jgi:hypothetical protein
MVTVTAPGQDVLPWRDGKVDPHRAAVWNATASARYARLFKAAQASADRLVRRLGYRGPLPRRVAVVWALQRRGVWHVHEGLPGKTPVEVAWSRQVIRFLDQARRREERLDPAERWALLEFEREFGVAPQRSVYGWGFVDRNPLRLGAPTAAWSAEAVARYLAANVARYLAGNASEPTYVIGRRLRSYVSRRLTMATGVTLTNLRRAHYLWRVLTEGLPLPDTWSEELLERVWLVLTTRPERAPPGLWRLAGS